MAIQAIESLRDLYLEKLQLIHDAELQALDTFPQLLSRVEHPQLREAIDTHVKQTREQAQKLEQLLAAAGVRRGQREPCASMRALVQETHRTLGRIDDPSTRDAFLIGAAQAVEHHEIADYGTARTWAQQLGLQQDAQVLDGILSQEKQADALLTQVAERVVNRDAVHAEREVARSAQSDLESSRGVRGGESRGRDAGSEGRM